MEPESQAAPASVVELNPFLGRVFGIDIADPVVLRTFADRVDLIFRHARTGVLVHILVATVTAYSMDVGDNTRDVWAWGAVMIALGLLRSVVIELYLRGHAGLTNPVRALIVFYVIIGITGLCWGAGGAFVLPDDSSRQVFFIMMLSGTAAGTVTTLASFYSAQILALCTSLLPLMLRFALDGSEEEAIMAAALLLFMAAMIATGRNTHLAVVSSLRLRLENVDLLDSLRRKSEELDATSRAKTRFLAAASHDLRQPLHALRLQAESLAVSVAAGTRARTIIDRIGLSVDAMERLLNSLLDISKLDADVVKPQMVEFCADTLLDALRQEFGAQASAAGCDLRFLRRGDWLESDPTLIETILRNLVGNAIRHAPGAKILVGCRRFGDTVCILVADTGPGIAPEHLDRVFEEFFQTGNPERDRDKGLGLGLSIVSRVATLLDLRMEFRSVPGRGTRFIFIVPPPPAPREVTQPAAPMPASRSVAGIAGSAVWIVDDDESGRMALADVVAQWGCETSAAASAAELLSAGLTAPDFVIADYRLREQTTGVEAIGAIRAHFGDASLPAVIVTGDTAPERLRELAASGVHVLHKPVQLGRLRSIMANLMVRVE